MSPAALSAIAADQAPTAFEKENYVRTFLDRYLNYDAHSISANWSYALNMMTGNLRSLTLADFQKATQSASTRRSMFGASSSYQRSPTHQQIQCCIPSLV